MSKLYLKSHRDQQGVQEDKIAQGSWLSYKLFITFQKVYFTNVWNKLQ